MQSTQIQGTGQQYFHGVDRPRRCSELLRIVSPAALILTLAGIAAAAPASMGVIGDSLSSEYQYTSASFARNWVELLAQSGNVNLGAIGSYGTPRDQGYANNWALGGATSNTMFSGGQVSGLVGQIPSAGIQYAVMEIGSDDIGPGGALYDAIYNGTATQTQITNEINTVSSNINTALNNLQATGVKVVVATAADHSLTPGTAAAFPSVPGRTAVSAVIGQMNQAILGVAQQHHVAAVDLDALQIAAGGTEASPRLSLAIGNVAIDLTQSATSNPSNAAWIFGGTHPNSAFQGIIANVFVQALNEGYNAGLPLFSEQQLLATQGLAYGGSDSLAGEIGPYSAFVDNFVPEPSTWELAAAGAALAAAARWRRRVTA